MFDSDELICYRGMFSTTMTLWKLLSVRVTEGWNQLEIDEQNLPSTALSQAGSGTSKHQNYILYPLSHVDLKKCLKEASKFTEPVLEINLHALLNQFALITVVRSDCQFQRFLALSQDGVEKLCHKILFSLQMYTNTIN